LERLNLFFIQKVGGKALPKIGIGDFSITDFQLGREGLGKEGKNIIRNFLEHFYSLLRGAFWKGPINYYWGWKEEEARIIFPIIGQGLKF